MDWTTAGADAAQASLQAARIVELEHEVATLRVAVAASRVTDAAVGLLMARQKLTRDEAFALLIAQSQYTNTKLAVLALEFVIEAEAHAAAREQNPVTRPPQTESRCIPVRPKAEDKHAVGPCCWLNGNRPRVPPSTRVFERLFG